MATRKPLPMPEIVSPATISGQENETLSALPAWASALDKVLSVQRPVVVAHLRGIRRRNPTLTGIQLLRVLERRYLTARDGWRSRCRHDCGDSRCRHRCRTGDSGRGNCGVSRIFGPLRAIGCRGSRAAGHRSRSCACPCRHHDARRCRQGSPATIFRGDSQNGQATLGILG